MASLDEYFKKRMGAFETAPTSPVSTPNETPDPAKAYIDRLSSTLSGNDPVVKNARQEASTKNAVGDYLAQRQAKQESNIAGYTPGTLQSQRTADRYQAGANEQALARESGVNELARGRADTAMSQANQLRQESVAQEERLRQEERQDIETLITSVQDPVTQAYLRRVQAAGGDVRAALAGNLNTNTTGGTNTPPGDGITPPITPPANPNWTPGQSFDVNGNPVDPNTGLPRSLTPAETALKNAEDEATTFGLVKGTQEYTDYVNARTRGASDAEARTIIEANKKAKQGDRLQAAITKGLNALTDAEYQALGADLVQTIASSVPSSRSAIDAAKNDPTTRGLIKLDDGNVYQLQDYYQQNRYERGGSDRHRDWAVATDRAGNTVYISSDGTIVNYRPPSASSAPSNKIEYKNGRFETTDGRAYYDPASQSWVTKKGIKAIKTGGF